ncbi:MAG: tandem-95 repeat protein [candidate division Zixibacteria bacterium]|nr:tandem-95 repeat protein [candidate division Zixibacteria bacterium]
MTITVTNTNRAPLLDPIGPKSVAENGNLTFRTHASDPDGNIPTLSALGVPLNATFVDSLNGAGSFVFNPGFNQSGSYNVTFITSDGTLADSELVVITVSNTNLPPVLDSIRAKSVAEGSTLSFRTHATDPDGTIPSLIAVGVPPNATFVDSLNGAGSFVFNPDFTQSGVFNVTFITTDGSLSDSEVVAITVTNVNLPPVLDSIRAKTVAENANLTFRAHATDPDGTIPVLTAVGVPLNATFVDSLNGAGSFVFNPDFTQSGGFSVTFIASDGALADSEVVTITVTNTNRPPVLDSIRARTVAENANLTFRTHASDPDGAIPTLTALGVPVNATFVDSLNGAGSFIFNPDFTQTGVYNVTFIASDGTLADSELVTITVTNTNRPPVLDSIRAKTVAENANLTFRTHATDPDGNIPTLTALGVPLNATFIDSLNGAGSLVFNPDFTQAGTYNLTFIVSDGSLADSEIVTITVTNTNRPPVLDAIGPKSVAEGTTLQFRTHGTDPDGTIPTFVALGVPLNATFVDSLNGAGSFTFNPIFSQAGTYPVTFITTDGSLADSEVVVITVSNTNLSPVLDSIRAKTVAEGANLTFRTHATDPDGTIPSLSAVGLPLNATFVDSLNGAGSLVFNPDFTQAAVYNVTFIASDGSLADSEVVAITVTNTNLPPVLDSIRAKTVAENANLTFRTHATDPDGNIPTLTAIGVPLNATFIDSLNGAGAFVFNPDFTQAGVFNVTFITSDGSLADSELVVITVTNTNRAPVLDSIRAKTVAENANLTFRTHATDPDGNIPTLTALGVPLNATFVDSLNGAGSFVFNPDFTQFGSFNVTFIASDGSLADSELVTITVTNTNRAPVLDSIRAKTVAENANLTFRTHATDPDGNIPTLTALGVPLNATFVDSLNGAGSFVFNPDFTQSGSYIVTFITSDGTLADSEVVTITVANTNRPPVLDFIGSKSVAEGSNLAFRTHATDPDGAIPTFVALGVPLNATFVDSLNGAGSFVFNPDFTQEGVYNVTIITTDGALADSELVVITVTNLNLRPVLDSIRAQTVAENANLTFRTHATDPDGTIPALTAIGVPLNATFVDSLNGAGSFVFNPSFTQSGVYTVTFIASDGSLADSEVVTITVTNTNRPPVLDSIRARTVAEGSNLTLRTHATDPDGNIPTLSALGVPLNAIFVDSGNGAGSFVFNPNYVQAGAYNVTFITSDGSLADSELVVITVTDYNPPPVLAPIGPKSVVETATLAFRVSASDLDGAIPVLTAAGVPANAVFVDSLNGAGSFTFTPSFFQAGTFNVTFIASDGLLADSELVIITVTNSNRPPTANAGPDQGPISIGTVVQLTGAASSDPDLDLLHYHWRQLTGTAVSLTDSTAVSPTFIPPVAGTYSWQLLVDDGLALSPPDTVNIAVVSQPKFITDLMANVVGQGVQLSWSSITQDTSGSATTLNRYVIYRGTRAYFAPTSAESIGTAVPSAISFTDNNIGGADVVGDTGTNYFYCIVAVDVAVNAVSRYIATSQSFESRFAAGFGTNFAIVPGGVYQVNAKLPTVFSVAGRVPDSGTVSYSIVTTSTTDYSFISIPFERELNYLVAQDVINALPGKLNTLNRFIPTSQSYESRFAAGFGTNFPVRPGRVYQANAAAPATFPGP